MSQRLQYRHHTASAEGLSVLLTPAAGGEPLNSPGIALAADEVEGNNQRFLFTGELAEELPADVYWAEVLEDGYVIYSDWVDLPGSGVGIIGDPLASSATAAATLAAVQAITAALVSGTAAGSPRTWAPISGIAPQLLRKQPAESLVFEFDFTAWLLEMGTSLASISSITATPTGLTLADDQLDGDNTGALVRISGGTHGTLHKVRVVALTVAGDTIEADGKLYVSNT